jgi:hypothetical protein
MKTKLPIIACTLLTSAILHPLFGGDVIDRIVATVNSHIILQSDWDTSIAVANLMSQQIRAKVDADFGPVDRKAALDRLIDQELLREQIPANDPQYEVEQSVIAASMQDIRQAYEIKTDQDWRNLLARYKLTEDEVRESVILQIKILRVIDEHLRPTVQVDEKSIQDYYDNLLLPALRAKHAKETPLAEATPQIREILTQKQIDVGLKEWLQNLHDSSTIVIKADALPNGGPAK